ncbi:hypothetical protein QTI51_11720 [Variovorax sp. J22G73]|uniref:hypothetical protein n=1 Tax=unclassified Variovorax TaxID=663243 RepID=UPI000E32CDD6|nr:MULTISPECIES: hypothetical protein [unclassified Variovorax]MDM0006030.1 hypothetical protein [Variovorax sp. J22R203]MDM0097946.1 hypothetical protein [Variovorax sp. J22G73]
MAKRIMARPSTPESPAAVHTAAASAPPAEAPAAATDAGHAGPGAADLLENKLEQLRSLLWCCRGEGIEWTGANGPTHLENMLWIASDLVREASELFERCAGDWKAKANAKA